MKMITRPFYLEKLLKWRDKALIKVVTGIRRCGKSTLLEQFRSELLKTGVSQKQIVALNFESPELADVANWSEVWNLIKPKLRPNKTTYVFLDEIQRVPEFQKLVDGLHVQPNVDVYITGSNASLLSGELATFLSGRYVEIKMHPFSFAEYCSAVNAAGDYSRHYANYVRYSSFPYAPMLEMDDDMTASYLDGIYSTVLVKDVLQRRKMTDASMVDKIVRYLFDNIGNVTSLRNMSNCLSAGGSKTNANTVDGYVDLLCGAFIFHRARRWDVRGKEFLQSGCKYYAADLGLRTRAIGNRVGDAGRILENVVFLELLRRFGNVMVGSHLGKEIDFVTRSSSDVHYWQVSETVRDESTRAREYAPLLAIRDHHPKTLLTLDEDLPAQMDGIRQINAFDFLLQSP